MVVGVFPAVKLGVLFVKQISKPLVKFLVSQAKNHPLFRTYFIIPPAQFYHWTEVKAKMYIMNLGKPVKVAKLNETVAIELGANLIGEVIIFGVAGGTLILEYNRQTTKETKKEETRQLQIQKFIDDIQTLQATTLQQDAQIQYLQSAINELAKHTRHKIQTPEPVIRLNESNNNVEDHTKGNSAKTSKTESGNEKKSFIERAIVYYNGDLNKTNKLS